MIGGIEYKKYIINPHVVCFNIRYFVYGDGFVFEHFKDIVSAEREIDRRIAREAIKEIIDKFSQQIDVSNDIIIECMKEILMND